MGATGYAIFAPSLDMSVICVVLEESSDDSFHSAASYSAEPITIDLKQPTANAGVGAGGEPPRVVISDFDEDIVAPMQVRGADTYAYKAKVPSTQTH